MARAAHPLALSPGIQMAGSGGARLPDRRQAGERGRAPHHEGGRGRARPEDRDRSGAGRAARHLRQPALLDHAVRRAARRGVRPRHAARHPEHAERQTGGMTRDIERGTRGISTLLSYLLFSIIPVILEFALVAAVLIHKFDWRFAAITFGAVAVYIGFTVLVTEWRMDIRRRANELDSKANTRAIDSLLNYETVK